MIRKDLVLRPAYLADFAADDMRPFLPGTFDGLVSDGCGVVIADCGTDDVCVCAVTEAQRKSASNETIARMKPHRLR